MRLPILLAAMAVALCSPAFGQSYDSPTALLKAFYKPYLADEIPDDQEGFRSAALNALYEADEENTPEGEMGALDFDPYIDGQDFAISALSIEEIEVDADTATVEVSFNNFDQPRVLTYDLVFENGSWRIDDVFGEGDDYTYRLSEIFAEAAQ
jgi:hypothetical protein